MGNISWKLESGALREKERWNLEPCIEKSLYKTQSYETPAEYQSPQNFAGQSLQEICV